MKRTITVTGIGHKSGTTKAGKPYDFHVVSGTYCDADYVQGVAACEYAVDDDMISGVEVGKAVHVFSHFYNGKTYVDAVIPV